MKCKVVNSTIEYQELQNQKLIINIFEKFEFHLSFRNMSYEHLLILNTKLLNSEFSDVFQEVINNNSEICKKLNYILNEFINEGFSKEKSWYFIEQEIRKDLAESFIIKREQKMADEINQFDFINAPSTSTGIYHLPSFKIQLN